MPKQSVQTRKNLLNKLANTNPNPQDSQLLNALNKCFPTLKLTNTSDPNTQSSILYAIQYLKQLYQLPTTTTNAQLLQATKTDFYNIKTLQSLYSSKVAPIKIDGFMGPETKAAIDEIKRRLYLPPNQYVTYFDLVCKMISAPAAPDVEVTQQQTAPTQTTPAQMSTVPTTIPTTAQASLSPYHLIAIASPSTQQIKTLQQLLKKFNPSIKIDGILGPSTLKTMQDVKAMYKLPTNPDQQADVQQIILSLSTPTPNQTTSPWNKPHTTQDIFNPNPTYNPSMP